MLKFEEYINEGKLVPKIRQKIHKMGVAMNLSKEDDDIAKWIIRRLKKEKFDESRYEHTGNYFADEEWKYTFLNPIRFPDIDPYGEENWNDNPIGSGITSIRVKKSKGEYGNYYYLYLLLPNRYAWMNLNVSKENIKTIKRILNQPNKKREEERKKREKEAEKMKARNLRKDIFENRIYNFEDFNLNEGRKKKGSVTKAVLKGLSKMRRAERMASGASHRTRVVKSKRTYNRQKEKRKR